MSNTRVSRVDLPLPPFIMPWLHSGQLHTRGLDRAVPSLRNIVKDTRKDTILPFTATCIVLGSLFAFATWDIWFKHSSLKSEDSGRYVGRHIRWMPRMSSMEGHYRRAGVGRSNPRVPRARARTGYKSGRERQCSSHISRTVLYP